MISVKYVCTQYAVFHLSFWKDLLLLVVASDWYLWRKAGSNQGISTTPISHIQPCPRFAPNDCHGPGRASNSNYDWEQAAPGIFLFIQGSFGDIAFSATTRAVIEKDLAIIESSGAPVLVTVPRFFCHRWSRNAGFIDLLEVEMEINGLELS